MTDQMPEWDREEPDSDLADSDLDPDMWDDDEGTGEETGGARQPSSMEGEWPESPDSE